MTCDMTKLYLNEYIDDELSNGVLETQIFLHLKECKECALHHEILKKIKDEGKTLLTDLPEDSMALITDEANRLQSKKNKAQYMKNMIFALSVLAAAVIIFTFAYNIIYLNKKASSDFVPGFSSTAVSSQVSSSEVMSSLPGSSENQSSSLTESDTSELPASSAVVPKDTLFPPAINDALPFNVRNSQYKYVLYFAASNFVNTNSEITSISDPPDTPIFITKLPAADVLAYLKTLGYEFVITSEDEGYGGIKLTEEYGLIVVLSN